jgi:hypothetical protein
MQSPHLRIVFSEDAQEWDRYVTDCLSRCIQTNAANSQLNVHHEKLENVSTNDSPTLNPSVSTGAVAPVNTQLICILILSPGLLQLLRRRPSLAEHIRSLGARIVCILCGVRRSDLLQQLYQSVSQQETQQEPTDSSANNNSATFPSPSVLRNALQWMHLWHMLDAEQQSEQLLPQLLLVIGRLLRQQQHVSASSATTSIDTIRKQSTSIDSSSISSDLDSASNRVSSSFEPEGEVYSLLSALTSGRPISAATSTVANNATVAPFNPSSCGASSCSSSGVSSGGSQVSSNEPIEKPSFKLRPHKVTQASSLSSLFLPLSLALRGQDDWDCRTFQTGSANWSHICMLKVFFFVFVFVFISPLSLSRVLLNGNKHYY